MDGPVVLITVQIEGAAGPTVHVDIEHGLVTS